MILRVRNSASVVDEETTGAHSGLGKNIKKEGPGLPLSLSLWTELVRTGLLAVKDNVSF